MKIEVSRTSCWLDEKPMDEAYMEKTISPYNGATIKKWYVDLDECDIFNVVNKYKSVILSKKENGYELEIYDDYRE